MKTFDELRPGDKLWLGHREESGKTITRIEPTRTGGKEFHYEARLMDGTPYEGIKSVGPSRLSGTTTSIQGNPDCKFFSCREAALENEAGKYIHTVHCIEGEIELLKTKLEKYQRKADELLAEKERISA